MSKTITTIILLLATISAASNQIDMDNLPSYVKSEIGCMAQNIYHEARGESFAGKLAVANVTMNRVHSGIFPNTVCDVVYQRGQFSWVSRLNAKKHVPEEYHELAKHVIIGQRADNTNGSLFFANKHVKVRRKQTTRIGNHIFYK